MLNLRLQYQFQGGGFVLGCVWMGLPGKSHGQKSLGRVRGYSPWGLKELDTTDRVDMPDSLSM